MGKSNSPTQLALKEALSLGFTAQVVERWNQFAGVRQDLFGCIDIVICRAGVGIIGVQACARGSHAIRRKKCAAEPRARAWIESGGRIEVWSFGKMGARGKRKTWQLWREEITPDMLTSEVVEEAEAA
jgi:hypothetical protein